MARNGHAAAGLLIVLALFGLAAWFVFMPAEPAPLTVAEDEAAAEVEGAEAEGGGMTGAAVQPSPTKGSLSAARAGSWGRSGGRGWSGGGAVWRKGGSGE